MTEIPVNCLLNKKQTGCGATELAIRNSIPTIIAMPYVALVKNKTIYRKDGISVLGVYEGISEQDIIDYVRTHSLLKIAVTYDSLPRVITALQSTGIILIKNYLIGGRMTCIVQFLLIPTYRHHQTSYFIRSVFSCHLYDRHAY